MWRLARFLGIVSDSRSLIFHSKGGGPLLETNILNQGLYPALEALGEVFGAANITTRWTLAQRQGFYYSR
jgi:hypothetical protein